MHKITNYREVKYDFDTKLDAFHWNDFIHEVKFTWFEEGNYYAVYEDLDEKDDHDRKKYAVYASGTGELICLVADSGSVLDGCYEDEEYMTERNKLYKQIAMLAGWPEKMPLRRMTWRDLLNELHKQPDDVLDMPAYINVTQETWTGLHEVTSLTTWDGEGEVDLEENQLLINFVEDGWMD